MIVYIKTGIVHIGIGRFHRAHEALYVDELLGIGDTQEWEYVVSGSYLLIVQSLMLWIVNKESIIWIEER